MAENIGTYDLILQQHFSFIKRINITLQKMSSIALKSNTFNHEEFDYTLRQPDNVYEKETFLKKLIRKGHDICYQFLQELARSGYEEEVDICLSEHNDDDSTNDQLNNVTKEKIEQNLDYIANNLEIGSALDMLFERQIITIDEHDEVQRKSTKSEKRRTIMSRLLSRPNTNWLSGFLRVLKNTGHIILLERLRQHDSNGQELAVLQLGHTIPLDLPNDFIARLSSNPTQREEREVINLQWIQQVMQETLDAGVIDIWEGSIYFYLSTFAPDTILAIFNGNGDAKLMTFLQRLFSGNRELLRQFQKDTIVQFELAEKPHDIFIDKCYGRWKSQIPTNKDEFCAGCYQATLRAHYKTVLDEIEDDIIQDTLARIDSTLNPTLYASQLCFLENKTRSEKAFTFLQYVLANQHVLSEFSKSFADHSQVKLERVKCRPCSWPAGTIISSKPRKIVFHFTIRMDVLGKIEIIPIKRELTTPSVALKLLDDRTDIAPRKSLEHMSLEDLPDMDSSGESADAFIPGLSKKGNRRPRIRCKKTSEIKAKIPVKQPQIETYTPKSKQLSSLSSDDTIESMLKENQRQHGKVSLKDLCAEDKKRVANLIKELARVGDEKEKCLGQLKNERENFEQQVFTLVQQREQVLKEREEVQQRLFQCHDLLSKYQDQILDKEKKLNDSIQEQQMSPRFNQYPYPVQRDHLQSPPTSQRSLSPASYQGRSPRDIQNQRKISREEIKSKVDRPFTSMIDKEIALQKSYDGPSTIMAEPSQYREPFKSSLPRNFREPIMSSTQKSVDINPFVTDSHDLFPLVPDASPRSSGQGSRGHTPRMASVKNKVGFKEKIESDENLQYSPNLHQSQIGDREYMKYYKKLRPSERKRELLKQREKLLEEQNRLQQVLHDQEEQLQHRQQLLIQKRKMQHERISSLEEQVEHDHQARDDGSVFNGRVDKLDFDKPLSEVDYDDIPNDAAEMADQGRISRHSIATSPLPRTPPTADKGTSISRMECSVQANIPITPPRIDVGTSISRTEFSNNANDILHTPTRMDAGTSISRVLPSQSDILSTPTKNDVDKFIDKMTEVTSNLSAMNPGSPGLSRQGNLPLPSNRGRSNASSVVKTPGDKTLNVVDIVNSLDEDFCSPQMFGNYRSPASKSQNKISSLNVKSSHSPNPEQIVYPRKTTRDSVANQNLFEDEESTIEEQEESHILEDIFFLK